MTPDEFRRHGHQLVDWIADYLTNVDQYPVQSAVEPEEILAQLPTTAPEEGESFEKIWADVQRILLPGITHWQSPNFYAYFPANNSGPSILGEMLSAGLGVQGMLWATSPACTELEMRVMDWLVDLMGLPERFRFDRAGGGTIQDSASSAILCALIAAREKATGGVINRKGVSQPLTAYASTQTHSSLEKGIRVAGVGSDNLRLVEVDETFALKPDQLEEAILRDKSAGNTPFFVCATLGTTSSTAFDPLAEIAELCQHHDIWLHVDAAMAGSAFCCPEHRHWLRGIEMADSYCFNPHKWMMVNFDCSCLFVSDRQKLTSSLSILPEYLKTSSTDTQQVTNYRDWQIPLGRRFRALKLWFVLRSFGKAKLQSVIREHIRLAQLFAQWVDESEDFDRVAPVPMNLVCFRHRSPDAFNRTLMDVLNASGELYLTHTRLADQFVLRMCIGQSNTTEAHVKQAWDWIVQTAKQLETASVR